MPEGCDGFDPGCWVGNAVGGAAASASDSVFESFVGWLMRGFFYGLKAVTTAWVHVDAPDLTRPDGTVTQIRGYLLWLTMVVMLAGVLVAAGKMVLLRDGRPAADLGKSLLIIVVVAAGSTALITALMQFGDLFAAHLIDATFSDQLIEKMSANSGANAAAAGGAAAGVAAVATGEVSAVAFLPLLIGLLAIGAQLGLMYFRIAVLVVFAAVMPLAAAGSATVTGRRWFERLVGWTFAFIVYKPIAAILYATGLVFMQEDTDGVTGLIAGVALLCAAVLAMPALVRLMAPAAAAVSGSGGGAGAAASVAAGVMGGPASGAAVTAMRQGGRG